MPRTDELTAVSFQQEEMLHNIRAFPDCAQRYHNSFLFRLTGDVDVDRLAHSIGDLVAHHRVLGTTLAVRDGADWQHVAGSAGPEFVDIRRAAPDETVVDIAAGLVRRRYGIEELCDGEPLFRPEIHLLTDDSVLLVLTLHHVLYDGWAISVLWRDLSEIYTARCEKRRPELPEQAIDYVEYTCRQREFWDRNRDDVMRYWREATASCPSDVAWPGPGDAAAAPFTTTTVTYDASRKQVARIREMSRSAQVSPFMVLLPATAATLAAVTEQDHLLLGVDTANRVDPAVHNLAGFCLNTRLIPLAWPARRPFAELVRSVRTSWLEADQFQEAYVDQILRELGRPEVLKINMLSEALDTTTLDLPGVDATPVDLPMSSLYWRPVYTEWRLAPGEYRLHITYQRSRIDPNAITSWTRELGDLLDRI
ncbi:condensation domain-containing protein [Streptomyces sp. NBC_01298]|uniref:condensation domain-containing protein n=1 Tax=Streptomyces sp. NBC_01298 TaxID=2903817 RepID=UPI002E110243|nr:condensation domain-containing protein [Streptomyces sp. NBC_01298]